MIQKKDALRLAGELRNGRDPNRVAAEMESLAARPANRPADPPMERVMRRLRRAIVAEGIYAGTFPLDLAGDTLRADVVHAKGRRRHADSAAGQILNCSVSQIEVARREYRRGLEINLGADKRPISAVDGRAAEELATMFYLHATTAPPD